MGPRVLGTGAASINADKKIKEIKEINLKDNVCCKRCEKELCVYLVGVALQLEEIICCCIAYCFTEEIF